VYTKFLKDSPLWGRVNLLICQDFCRARGLIDQCLVTPFITYFGGLCLLTLLTVHSTSSSWQLVQATVLLVASQRTLRALHRRHACRALLPLVRWLRRDVVFASVLFSSGELGAAELVMVAQDLPPISSRSVHVPDALSHTTNDTVSE